MAKLERRDIRRFRRRIYQERAPRLFKTGENDLKPLVSMALDPVQNTVVSVEEILSFFTERAHTSVSPETYVHNLHQLFEVLTLGAEAISFDCGIAVSEKTVMEARPGEVVSHLTRNIVLTYFNYLKTAQGGVNYGLLDAGLATVIQKSNAQRSYDRLREKILEDLKSTLAGDGPWQRDLEMVVQAGLVRRLTGGALDQWKDLDAGGLLKKMGRDMEKYNQVFTRIMKTRGALLARTGNISSLDRALEGVEQALAMVLEKVNAFLGDCTTLEGAMGIPVREAVGTSGQDLDRNLVQLFFSEPALADSDPSQQVPSRHALFRYQIHHLLSHPHIARYCRSFREDLRHSHPYLNRFRYGFHYLLHLMAELGEQGGRADMSRLALALEDSLELIRLLEPGGDVLASERRDLGQAYLDLVEQAHPSCIEAVIACRGPMAELIQDPDLHLLTQTRRFLFENSFKAMDAYAGERRSLDAFKTGIRRLLHTYASNFTPQRDFYQFFYSRYVGQADGSVAQRLMELRRTNPAFVLALLSVMSEPHAMDRLLKENQMAFARDLFVKFQ